MNIIEQVREHIREYESKTGKRPAKIRLTGDQEMDLEKLKHDEIGRPAAQSYQKGVRGALTDIDGIPVEWDANRFELK